MAGHDAFHMLAGQRRLCQFGEGDKAGTQAVVQVVVEIGDVVGQRGQLRLQSRPGRQLQRPAGIE